MKPLFGQDPQALKMAELESLIFRFVDIGNNMSDLKVEFSKRQRLRESRSSPESFMDRLDAVSR